MWRAKDSLYSQEEGLSHASTDFMLLIIGIGLAKLSLTLLLSNIPLTFCQKCHMSHYGPSRLGSHYIRFDAARGFKAQYFSLPPDSNIAFI